MATVLENKTALAAAEDDTSKRSGELQAIARDFESLSIRFVNEQREKSEEINGTVAMARLAMTSKLGVADKAAELIRLVDQADRSEKAFRIDSDEKSVVMFDGAIAKVLEIAAGHAGADHGRIASRDIASLREAAASYRDSFASVVELTARQAAADDAMKTAATSVTDIVGAFRASMAKDMTAQKDAATTLLIAGTIGALVLGALLSFLIGSGLARSIRRITVVMKRLSSGDLDVEIPALGRKDEIGDMAAAVQVFRDNAHDKISARTRAEGERAGGRGRKASGNVLVGGLLRKLHRRCRRAGLERLFGTERVLDSRQQCRVECCRAVDDRRVRFGARVGQCR